MGIASRMEGKASQRRVMDTAGEIYSPFPASSEHAGEGDPRPELRDRDFRTET